MINNAYIEELTLYKVQCTVCKNVSRSYEPFTTLNIHLDDASTSVEEVRSSY